MERILLGAILATLLSTLSLPSRSAPDRPALQHVLVVLIFDQGCKAWCVKVRPMMKELQAQYGDKVEFIELDTSPETLKGSEVKARELGVFCFLRDSADWVPIVGVFTPQRKLVKELVGPKGKDVYAQVIDKALATR